MGTDDFSRKRPDAAASVRSQKAAEPDHVANAPAAGRAAGKDLGRVRAQVAWGWVNEVEKSLRDEKENARYGTLARKLPTYLQVSGLAQTLAFLFSKSSKKPEGLLLTQLSEHLRARLSPRPEGEFMKAVLELSPSAYRTATREALSVADWLKRFAEGRLGTEEGE